MGNEAVYIPWELTTWKRELIDNEWKYWSNSFPIAAGAQIEAETAFQICHAVATAEQFIYAGTVEVFGAIVHQPSLFRKYADAGAVFVWPAHRFGMRSEGTEGAQLDFSYALVVAKIPNVGRAGRVAFRRVLWEANVAAGAGDYRALINSRPFGGYPDELFLFWLKQVAYPHAIFKRDSEIDYPSEIIPTPTLEMHNAIRLHSVEDAQARKTMRARPFEVQWKELLYSSFGYFRVIEYIRHETGSGMRTESIPQLRSMVSDMLNRAKAVAGYWKEGIKPELIFNWRPTAGLDPYSFDAQQLLEEAINAFKTVEKMIDELPQEPGEVVESTDTLQIVIQLSWILGLIEKTGITRWTGTPIQGNFNSYE